MKFNHIISTSLALVFTCSAFFAHGVSIRNLLEKKQVPKIKDTAIGKKLDLSKKNITNLEGLGDINGIDTVKFLNLSYNELSSLPPDIFMNLSNLKVLALHANKLQKFDVNVPNDIYLITLWKNKIDKLEKVYPKKIYPKLEIYLKLSNLIKDTLKKALSLMASGEGPDYKFVIKNYIITELKPGTEIKATR